ncbi:LysR substrate-binding domain-containing protein [Cupriavidus oxalaticus]
MCATKIVEDELILVASPRLIRDKHICFVAPSNFICLRNSERDYLEQWNRQSDAQHQICERSSTVWFNDSAALLEAVENECGYTVTRKSLVWDDLKSGSLRQISDQSFRDGLAYYAVTEPRKAGAKIIQIFIKWLQEIYI